MAQGIYASSAQMQLFAGDTNIATWSSIDNTGAYNDAAVQQALNWADAQINAAFAGSNYAVPLTNASVNGMVNQWGIVLATWYIYSKRGLIDTDKDGNRYTAQEQKVRAEMRFMVASTSRMPDAARRWPTQTAPACY